MTQDRIRNFSIIAHIDHGKSTLADRILELTHAVSSRDMRAQVLDSMDLERERGITIKAQAVRVEWKGHQLNLIDTPGHVDFTYEVSRSLQACEGALLVVDAAQGTQAQTLANAYLAIENDLEIVPVVNKIDLPQADPDGAAARDRGPDRRRCRTMCCGSRRRRAPDVEEVLDAIVERVPPPAGDLDAPARALIFDSSYDQYRGVVAFVRVVDGRFSTREPLRAMALGTRFEAEELGFFSPTRRESRNARGRRGRLRHHRTEGRLAPARRRHASPRRGRPAAEPLPGYKDVKPMVFAGLFPTDSDDYPELRDALEKLKLNDAALFYEPETSQALGFGFRCGFLGLLHMEIVRERLEREFDLDLLVTAPNVAYRVKPPNGEWREVHTPTDMPNELEEVEEPYIKASIIVPKEFVGAVMELNNDRRGRFDHLEYLSEERVHLTYELPLAEIVLDYYDQLKSRTRGLCELRLRRDRLPAGQARARRRARRRREPVDALSLVVHRDSAYDRGRLLVERLREEIPRQHFDVAIQAAIGARVIARETVKARRKDVLAKCYGGDITRKRKLLERQKAGKKRMKQVGMVEVPQEAFLAVLNLDGDEEVVSAAHGISTCTCRSARTVAATATSSPSSVGEGSTRAYVDALLAELELERDRYSRPSSRPSSSAAARRRSRSRPRWSGCSPPCRRHGEVTVEANPETVTQELARMLRRLGVNRVSLGVQSFQPHLLTVLERVARPDTVRRAFYHLRDAGFDNISFDLIYGIPGQSAADARSGSARGARPWARAPLLLRAGGEARHAFHPRPRRGARAPGRRDGGVLRDRRRAADRAPDIAGTRQRTSAAPRYVVTSARSTTSPTGSGRDYLGLGIGAVSTIERQPLAQHAPPARRTSRRSPPASARPRLEPLSPRRAAGENAHARPPARRAARASPVSRSVVDPSASRDCNGSVSCAASRDATGAPTLVAHAARAACSAAASPRTCSREPPLRGKIPANGRRIKQSRSPIASARSSRA